MSEVYANEARLMLAEEGALLLPDHVTEVFDPDTRDFLLRMYDGNQDRYDERIKSIGLCGMERVLDAGCGFGQWSQRLAKYNAQVEAIDINAGCLLAAQKIAEKQNIDNLTFKFGMHAATGYPDAYFDAVFCYSSIFLTDEGPAIKEFNRVLKKSGKLYFNYNGLGTYLYFLIEKGFKESNRFYLRDAVASIISTLCRRKLRPHIITDSRMSKLLRRNNFEVLSRGPDGHVSAEKNNLKDQPMFIGSYGGFNTIREILAQKL